jgi:hypothetical protein
VAASPIIRRPQGVNGYLLTITRYGNNQRVPRTFFLPQSLGDVIRRSH